MRAGEQFSLLWKQVDFNLKQIHLPKTKNGKPRYIDLNPAAVAALETLKQGTGGSKHLPVFPNREGDAVQGPRGWFKSAVDRAGIRDYSWHCNRHTFASKLAQNGTSLHMVGDLLGHKSLQMTQRYSHLLPAQKQAAVSSISFEQLTPELTPAS